MSDGKDTDQEEKSIVVEKSGSGSTGGGGEPCPGIPTITYAGKTYNTVQIGNQCWLKENLNVGTKLNRNSSSDNDTIEKYCHPRDLANCETYGGFYKWDEAMQYVTTEGAQGICPSGWHIPTFAEMQALETYVNDEATKLIDENAKSSYTTYTNETGFSALFAGNRNIFTWSFSNLEYDAHFWSSTEYNSYYAYRMNLNFLISSVSFFNYDKNYGFSVRCLKD